MNSCSNIDIASSKVVDTAEQRHIEENNADGCEYFLKPY